MIRAVERFTMTSPERIAAICQATRYVVSNEVPGAIVGCGVWRGGSTMAAAYTLLAGGDTDRELSLYDTYTGMTQPTEADRDAGGRAASEIMSSLGSDRHGSAWCYASLEDVTANLTSTGYPRERMHFVVGPVEETIPGTAPDRIALLRLDTDWYESTRHELVHLFPRLSARRSADHRRLRALAGCAAGGRRVPRGDGLPILLSRIDYTGRIGVMRGLPGMLTKEAAWLKQELAWLPDESLDPLLSVGSGTTDAREVLQPWIADLVLEPLERRGVRVIHHEYAEGPGVDVAGDLGDPAVAERLRGLGARSVLCCNVLEHLADRSPVTSLLESLVTPGGYLIVSVPRRFPFHPDPIDTMYRPSVAELASEFPRLQLERGEEVECGTLLSYLRSSGSLRRSLTNGFRVALARLRRDRGANESARRPAGDSLPAASGTGALPYLVRSTAVTCAVLREPGPAVTARAAASADRQALRCRGGRCRALAPPERARRRRWPRLRVWPG